MSETVSSNRSSPVNSIATAAPVSVKPMNKPFDVTSIIKNTACIENTINDIKSGLPYKPDQWAPDRPDGKKKYDRDFLLALKNCPASRQKPDNILENVVLDDWNTLPSNKPQPEISISLRGENAWKPARFYKGENMSEDEKKTDVLYREVQAVLNKLTFQKFDELVNQVRQLQIDNRERVQGVIDLVFEKAINEPNFSFECAMMCEEIHNMQVSVAAGDDKKNLEFRTLLLTRCQVEFEKQFVDESDRNLKVKELDACSDNERKEELGFELEQYDRRLRMKSVGTIRFVGELFKRQMLSASIIKRYSLTLLDNKDEESLECLCKLLTVAGKELESKSVDLSSIFDEMKRITDGKKQKVSSRIRSMLQDVIDLRNSNWCKTMHIQVMNMNPSRKDGRNVGPRGGGFRQKVSDDGWNWGMGPRNNRQQFSFQSDKIRAAKLSLEDNESELLFQGDTETLEIKSPFGLWGASSSWSNQSKPKRERAEIYKESMDASRSRAAELLQTWNTKPASNPNMNFLQMIKLEMETIPQADIVDDLKENFMRLIFEAKRESRRRND